jgi:hypothetical protein
LQPDIPLFSCAPIPQYYVILLIVFDAQQNA